MNDIQGRMSFQDLLLPFTLLQLAGILGFTFLCWTYLRPHLFLISRNPPYPPGPPSKSLLFGNLSDVPSKRPYLKYAEWAETYGDIIHVRLYGEHIVVLNSIEVVRDLIEKRSHIYSDRPEVPMIKLMEWDFNAGHKPFGAEWKLHRRLFDQVLRPSAAVNYRPIQARKTHDMLYGLLTSPDDFRNHYRTVAAAIIMSAVYGYDIEPNGDYFVKLAEDAVATLSESILPGASAVNALPILRFLPAWFPGAGFKRFANRAKALTRQMRAVPFDFVEKGMAEGTASPCIVTELLTKSEKTENYSQEYIKEVIKEVAATCYAAGADTSVSSLGSFFYAMVLHPSVQEKAQQELDAVIGSDRLVTFDDRPSLPYIEAIYREVMRWKPVTPLAVQRRASQDDMYKGFYIPKGATVLMNVWGMAHDPRKYKDPELFNPDRFFGADGKLTPDFDAYTFGFGRRICAGRHMASATIWLAMASVLASFNIGRKKDALGNYISLDGEYTDALICHPPPFECSITPRSNEAIKLILEAAGKTPAAEGST